MIGEDDIRKVREATDLVALIGERVVLKQRGREFWGCCPFHNEKSPSFKIDPASQFYHCFGCGEGGDAFKFVMRTENLEFPDAVRYLAQRARIELVEDGTALDKGKRARLFSVCLKTAEFYHQQLMRTRGGEVDAARAYLAGRDFGGTVPRDWMLGFAPGNGKLVRHLTQQGFTHAEMTEANVALAGEGGRLRDRFYNRVMFPLWDMQGRVIAFGGRIIGSGEPKYINTADSPLFHKRENLYAIDRAKAAITSGGTAVVVEGYTDTIAMHRAGFVNTVATLGTALTPQHVKLLTRFAKKVVYLFDGDEAGKRAAGKASQLISRIVTPESGPSNKVDLMVALLPGGMDPADFCASQGREGMEKVLAAAVPLLRFALDQRLEAWDLKQPEHRARALEDVVQLLVPVKGSLLATDYLNYLADMFLTDYATVSAALDRARPLAPVQDEGDVNASNPKPVAPVAASAQGDRLVELERELLILFIEEPATRPLLDKALGRIDWGLPLHRHMAEVLLAKDHGLPAAQLAGEVTTEVPEAAQVLGASRSRASGDEALRLARILMYTLREEQLTRRIRQGNARLRTLGTQAGEEYDALFREVADLQKELTGLRRRQADDRQE